MTHETKKSKLTRTSTVVLLALCSLLVLTPALYGAPSDAGSSQDSSQELEVSWFRRHFGRFNWEETLQLCNSPREVCAMVDRHLRYRRERKDDWRPARETWKTRRGDCEDFAIVIMELCRQLGFECEIRLYFPPRRQGHAVAVGTWNGQMWMSNMGSYEEVDSSQEIEEHLLAYFGCRDANMWNAIVRHEDLPRFIDTEHDYDVAEHN